MSEKKDTLIEKIKINFKTMNKEYLCVGVVLAMCFFISLPFTCGIIVGAIVKTLYTHN